MSPLRLIILLFHYYKSVTHPVYNEAIHYTIGNDKIKKNIVILGTKKFIFIFVVLHFRQLRGNQKFVLSHDAADDFCKRVRLHMQI